MTSTDRNQFGSKVSASNAFCAHVTINVTTFNIHIVQYSTAAHDLGHVQSTTALMAVPIQANDFM